MGKQCPQLDFFKLNTIDTLIKSFIHSFEKYQAISHIGPQYLQDTLYVTDSTTGMIRANRLIGQLINTGMYL